jgi:hypothetical protein
MAADSVSQGLGEGGPRRIIAALNLDGTERKWTTSCPAHEDASPSLSVRLVNNGNLLLRCHAGCKTDAILAAIGAHPSDLFERQRSTKREAEEPTATYSYVDENGALLYQVLRYADKNFKQRRPNGDGTWLWGTAGVRRVLYNLPSIREAVAEERRIFVVEGEKDAEALQGIGCIATTNCCGAGRWREEHTSALRDAVVAVIPDNDKPGDEHAAAVALAVSSTAAEVRIVRLPGLGDGQDVSDWLQRGGSREQLEALVASSAVVEAPKQLALRSEKKFRFLTLEQLAQLPPVPWLVEEILPAGAFAIVFAPPASFKSFLCIDLALSIATGKPWHDHAAIQGTVVYVAAEGNPSELYKRASAWLGYHRLTTSDFYCTPNRLDLGDMISVEAFIRELPVKPELIVVDTLARCTLGLDENGTRDMGRAVASVDRLRGTFGCAVLLVHHTRKSDGGMRGNSSLEGAADTMISLHRTRHGPLVRIRCEKQKDAIEFADHTACLTDAPPSAVLVPTKTPKEERGLSANDRLLLGCLDQGGMATREWKEASKLGNSSYNKSKKRLLDAGKVSYDLTTKRFRLVVADIPAQTDEGGDA